MESIWRKSVQKQKYEKLEKDSYCDVCIVGAGITGLSCGYELAKEGIQVIILEKDRIGSETSGNTTGKITSQHGLFYRYLLDTYGEDFARRYLEANQGAKENIKQIIQEEKIECDLENQDNYVFATNQIEQEKIKLEVEAVQNLGFDAEFVPELDIPIENMGGIVFRNQAQFNSVKYMQGLANAIVQKEGRIYEKSKVVNTQKDEEGYLVETEDYVVHAKFVILATRYPIKSFPGFHFLKMYQSTSYAIAFETQKTLFNGMYISDTTPVISLRTSVYENRRVGILAGEDHKTGKQEEEDHIKALEEQLKKMYPDAKIKFEWEAEDCISLDKLPYIGEFSTLMPHLYIATGFKKWGITTSNLAANILKDLILERENLYVDLFDSKRLKPIQNHTEMVDMLKEAGNSILLKKLVLPKEKIQDVEEEEGCVVEYQGDKIGVYKEKGGKIFAVKPICTHLGCELVFNSTLKTWDCPCHGSRFDYKGRSISTPSVHNLDVYNLEID